jgi:hypothetical protein
MPRVAVVSLVGLVFFGGAMSLMEFGPLTHACNLDQIGVASISCQESPQSPTASCCDAHLLYAIDTMACYGPCRRRPAISPCRRTDERSHILGLLVILFYVGHVCVVASANSVSHRITCL